MEVEDPNSTQPYFMEDDHGAVVAAAANHPQEATEAFLQNLANLLYPSSVDQRPTHEQLFQFLASLEALWLGSDEGETRKRMLSNFGMQETGFLAPQELDGHYKKHLCAVMSLHLMFKEQGLISDDERDIENSLRFTKLFDVLWNSRLITYAENRIRMAVHDIYDTYTPSDIGMFRFCPFEAGEMTEYQKYLVYLTDTLYQKRWRRYKDWCMEQTRTKEGYLTHSWQPVLSIEEFVYSSVDRVVQADQWYNVTKQRNNPKDAIQYLTKFRLTEFADLKKDRHIFSFNTGLYIAPMDKYMPFSDITSIPHDLVACNYFDLEFDNDSYHSYEDWYDIPTPTFQSILDYQDFPATVCRWFYVFVGRMIYEVGELDDWQVIGFLEGLAGSGKSSLLKVVKAFYHPEDVGALSNNPEKTFGLSGIFEKLIYLGFDVKGDFGLGQAAFQSMISGEDVSIAQKFKTAISIVWQIPGMLAGNETPAWIDNAGSMARRVVVWKFAKKVDSKDKNAKMAQDLKQEMPALIKKCNVAYLAAVEAYGNDDIWRHLPAYFLDTQREMQQTCNALHAFLVSDKIVKDEGRYVPKDVFLQAFKLFCQSENRLQPRFSTDLFIPIFAQHNIQVEKESLPYPPTAQDKVRTCTFFRNLDIVE